MLSLLIRSRSCSCLTELSKHVHLCLTWLATRNSEIAEALAYLVYCEVERPRILFIICCGVYFALFAIFFIFYLLICGIFTEAR